MTAPSRDLRYKRDWMRRHNADHRARMAALGLTVGGRPLRPRGWVKEPRPGCCPRCDLLSLSGLCGYCLAELAAEVAPLAG